MSEETHGEGRTAVGFGGRLVVEAAEIPGGQ